MSYKVAAIDIHKKVRTVVVAAVAEEVAEATGAAVEGEGRKFGTGARERNHPVSWLQQHQVREVVLESTGEYSALSSALIGRVQVPPALG